MVLIFTAGNRHLFKVIFFKLKSAWILLILAAERGGGERGLACPVFVRLSAGCWGDLCRWGGGCRLSGRTADCGSRVGVLYQHQLLLWLAKPRTWYSALFLAALITALRLGRMEQLRWELTVSCASCGAPAWPLRWVALCLFALLCGFDSIGLWVAPWCSGCWPWSLGQFLGPLVLAP